MIDFALLYDHALSTPCALWQQCSSHCCTPGRLVRPYEENVDLTVLPIPAQEFDYLRSISAPGVQWDEEPRRLELELSDYHLTLYMQPCNLGGACESGLRPTLCRIYPYVPLIDDRLGVSAVMNATAFDLMWSDSGPADPCLLRGPAEREPILASLRDLVAQLARRPESHELLLWFNLAYRYLEAFAEYLEENVPDRAQLSQDELFRAFHTCNRTQLFLADPDFRARLDAEVARYRAWSA